MTGELILEGGVLRRDGVLPDPDKRAFRGEPLLAGAEVHRSGQRPPDALRSVARTVGIVLEEWRRPTPEPLSPESIAATIWRARSGPRHRMQEAENKGKMQRARGGSSFAQPAAEYAGCTSSHRTEGSTSIRARILSIFVFATPSSESREIMLKQPSSEVLRRTTCMMRSRRFSPPRVRVS